MGSRDLQPNDLIAAVDNMLDGAKKLRQTYLGLDFIRPGTRLPKLQIWQEQLLESYPHVADLALAPGDDINLLPSGSTAIRIHSVGGWGAITMGKNLAMTAAELAGMYIKANPKYGSEKKGQPTTFYAVLAHEPIKLNCELKHVNVVLSPDANVFRHSNPIAGLADNGVFIIQSDMTPEALWESLPSAAQREIRDRHIRLYTLDGFQIASDEASDPELRYRMQGAAFMGAFFHASDLRDEENLSEEALFEGIRKQLQKKFGHLGEHVVADNVRVIRRGYDELHAVDTTELTDRASDRGALPVMPSAMNQPLVCQGIGDAGRFWEQVGFGYATGDDGIADPFAALSAIPAGTSTMRDMTDVRFEVPEFIADKCTGCSQCWVQCPDAAIPGLVTEIDALVTSTIAALSNGRSFDRLRQIVKPLARESRKILKNAPFHDFGSVLREAYATVIEKMAPDPERREQLDAEFGPIAAAIAEFPLAKTAPFFDAPEAKEKGSGALLSITINPEACKGCNICVDVCPDDALITVKQTEPVVEKLRRNWDLWQKLPDTPDRYVNVRNVDEGIGVLSTLLLKKENYQSMFGGDGACMGCGEKTAVHLVLSAVNALMLPRVADYVQELDTLIEGLDHKARELLVADADLDAIEPEEDQVAITVDTTNKERIDHINAIIRDLKDLRWRYTEGPSGHGRSSLGITNATGCSSVWGSTYPFNPYPFPWVNHLFQDAPSIAIGIFEGHMRKMADGFKAVRRAELELEDAYDATEHEPFLEAFDWRSFSDDEFKMCPPIFAIGGDGAMLDIGFQNLSRLLASGKPVRVMVLDTQVYSNTGGQACTSGFLGQVSDMAAFGASQHGKEEVRKELSLLAIAHRNVFVHQSSQASPSHLLSGVLRALQSRLPAVLILHCPCPPEHGLGDDSAVRAARLALESRAFPLLTYDPQAGVALADCLDLDGNPALQDTWPSYDLKYLDDDGNEQSMSLPVTIADWAATEARFKKHFRMITPDHAGDLVPFHEYLAMDAEGRDACAPFIYVINDERQLQRLLVSEEMVALAEDRQTFWQELQHLAGVAMSDSVRDSLTGEIEAEFEARLERLRGEYEAKLANLKATYPQLIARRLAEGLIKAGNGQTVGDLLARVEATPGLKPITVTSTAGVVEVPMDSAPPVPATSAPSAEAVTATAVDTAPAPAEVEEEEEDFGMEAYIETARCTSCDECTNLNNQMFAYDENKQAYIKDASKGTFKELVLAAERCPVAIIHPGTPLNPKERDLEKWVKRAEPFA
jgi:pyruvate-ferredoxin/flavodoxin oxidoreductase